MMQGNRVTKSHLSHTYWQYDARPNLKCISEYNCGTLQIRVLPEIWLTTAEPTGWQIYKEPEPQYKVGDWVEYRLHANTAASDNNMMGQIIDIGRIGGTSIEVLPVGNYEHNSSLSTYHVIYASRIIRKLKPSEVIVNIGCLSGTVEDLSYASDGRFWLIGKATERRQQGMFVLLYDEMLDTPTSNLVESLLEGRRRRMKTTYGILSKDKRDGVLPQLTIYGRKYVCTIWQNYLMKFKSMKGIAVLINLELASYLLDKPKQ